MSMTDEKNPDVELTDFGAVLPSRPTSRDVIKRGRAHWMVCSPESTPGSCS